jgi:iron complex transport system ATP-binding protein
VDLGVAPGEFVGLIGPNGCGKTTLLRVISGVIRPTVGEVLLENQNVSRMSRRSLGRLLAVLLQDSATDMAFTVGEVAAMGRWPHLSTFGVETRRDRQIVREALDVADIAHLADKPITAISGGERQRAFFAMCLAQQPRVLLLDEPLSHLDIGHQLSMLSLIRRLNRQLGLTVLAVFHDLNMAAEFCDRLAVLHEGRLAAVGDAADVLKPQLLKQVYRTTLDVMVNPITGRPQIVISARETLVRHNPL